MRLARTATVVADGLYATRSDDLVEVSVGLATVGSDTQSAKEPSMTGGSWPYVPDQCPGCIYVHALSPFIDDSGYEIVGFCRHPRIAMELFVPQGPKLSSSKRCPLFVPESFGSPRGGQ